MRSHKIIPKITRNPFFQLSYLYLILSLPLAMLVGILSDNLFGVYPTEFFWGSFTRDWHDGTGSLAALSLAFLAALALLAFKTKRSRKKQKPGFDYAVRPVIKRSLATLGFGLVWLSLLPLPFLSRCIDLFTRKSFVHFTYWKPFGLQHVLIDAPRHTNEYIIGGYNCQDHLMTNGWIVFWAFNLSLALGALTVWAIITVRDNKKAATQN